MKKLDLKIGFLCNNRCKFCVQGTKREKFGNKSFRRLVAEMKEARRDCGDIVFTGGEPTLRSDFFDLVKAAKEMGFKNIQIQTNGRLFAYKDFCRRTIEAGATDFSPAIHGHNARLHDFLTSTPGSFEETLRGIKNLVALDRVVCTNTVITKPNFRYLPQIAKLLAKAGVYQYQFAFVHITGRAAENKDVIVPRKSEIMPYVKKGLDVGVKAGIRVMTEAIPYCFMRGYKDYIAEKVIPRARVYDADFVIDDYSEYRKNKGKSKGPRCPECKYFGICEGPWKEYPELFGWREFRPIK